MCIAHRLLLSTSEISDATASMPSPGYFALQHRVAPPRKAYSLTSSAFIAFGALCPFSLFKPVFRGSHILEINTDKKINPDSIIPVEKIEAPILMFSTEVDTIWPSKESCEKLEERLNINKFSYPHKHICFRHISHMMLENCGKSIKWFIKSEKQFP